MNNKTDIIITIGITAFNEGELLNEAWNSVVNQSNPDWKAVMILDGGANRKTRNVFHKIQHPNLIKFSFKHNKGPYPCRSKAIELADTEWYFQLDGDDMLPGKSIEFVIDAIGNNSKAQYITGCCEHFDSIQSTIIEPLKDADFLCFHPLFFPQTPVRKSLLNEMKGYYVPDHFFHSDWDFWLSVYENEIPGVEINEILYLRRKRNDSVTNKNFHALPNALECIISRHPIFYNSEERKNKARHNLYEKSARRYRADGRRKLAKKYADLTILHGDPTQIIESINLEIQMPLWRYYIRRLRRLFH